VDSVRCQAFEIHGYIQHILPPHCSPLLNDVKNHLMYLNKIAPNPLLVHHQMNHVTATNNKLHVEPTVITPTPTLVQNYNPTFLTLQLFQCAMCGQSQPTHPERCPQYGKAVCSACERPNHASLFCYVSRKTFKSLILQNL